MQRTYQPAQAGRNRLLIQTSVAFDSRLRQLAWFMISSRFFERFIGDLQVIVLAVVATGSLPNGSQPAALSRNRFPSRKRRTVGSER